MRRLTPATATTLAALFIGGASYASLATTGVSVRDGSLTGADIKNNSLTTSDIKDKSLRMTDFAPGQVPAGPKGDTGPAGPAGAPGPAGTGGLKGSATLGYSMLQPGACSAPTLPGVSATTTSVLLITPVDPSTLLTFTPEVLTSGAARAKACNTSGVTFGAPNTTTYIKVNYVIF